MSFLEHKKICSAFVFTSRTSCSLIYYFVSRAFTKLIFPELIYHKRIPHLTGCVEGGWSIHQSGSTQLKAVNPMPLDFVWVGGVFPIAQNS